jgi:DNA-binding helix-hairpin-helix protein with protein kinase domain
MSTPLRTHDGRSITLGALIGRGGEGSVYAVAGDAHSVAKLYTQLPDEAKRRKLREMVADQHAELRAVAAWPSATLLDARGREVGILMPRVHGAIEAHNVYAIKARWQHLPQARWDTLVRVARNTAAAVHAVHEAGHVIGDLNQRGVLVAADATVRLIDCDSFQVQAGSELHLCRVGVPDFTAPELMGRDFGSTARSAEHDRFGLAVLLFHFLFFGRHPYAGRLRSGADLTIDDAVRRGLFAYGRRATALGIERPKASFPLGIVPDAVAQLFERAFAPDAATAGRPSAEEWVLALDAMESELVTCPRERMHRHRPGLSKCPWCAAIDELSLWLFLPSQPAKLAGVVDRDTWVQLLAALDLPDPLPSVPCALPRGLVGARTRGPSCGASGCTGA